jgi:hypothetical protein
MQLTTEEKQKLLSCINVTIKASPNAIQTAADLLELAQKLSALNEPCQPSQT